MITLPDYALDYMENLNQSGRSKLTLKQYESDLKKFFSWLDIYKENTKFETIKALRADDIRAYFHYLKDKQLSQATIRRLASVLSRLMIYHQCVCAHEIHKLAEASPLRPLTTKDFITSEEYNKLLQHLLIKDIESTKKSARNYLLSRNWTIVALLKNFGLTPIDIYRIKMKDLNLAQGELTLNREDAPLTLPLSHDIMTKLRDYYFSIPEAFRPKYYSNDPVFIAFNNISYSFQYDYDRQKPKALSVRAIQEMIKDEVRRAGLRKISAVNLRNAAILEALATGASDEKVMRQFHLTSEAALRRYKQYLLNKMND
ncbi:tyrosine-type recombinase/integrase [Niallia sp. Sow4_A1]|uniref:Site-specific integrase n=1 Tax=Niallia hominis TaxID=3133173 RepID=A0ABV1F3C9_9BACI|nr:MULTISPECIES: site-specific integrase [Bacillaceae]MCF2648332.1 site-specific integrase [Niallia circulans]CAI9386812.1 Tyrosine recombinase XerC [Bacillus sp. T2.9-1]